MMLGLIIYGLLSLALSLFVIPLFKFFAIKLGVVDAPDGKIKVHSVATPYLGGIAVISVTTLILLLMSIDGFFLINYICYWPVFVGLVGLALLGCVDDLFIINPLQKAIGQAIVALFFVSYGYHLHCNFLPIIALQGISFFWFMLMSNALNLIDIMDGLAGVVACIALFFFGGWAYIAGNLEMTSFTVVLGGSLLGFLWNNKPRATIYLGDAGSLFLGGALGVLPFLLTMHYENNIRIFVACVIALGIPLTETLFLILIRTHKGIPFYKASPHHFICYLKNKSWSEREILGGVVFCGIGLGLLATAFFHGMISFCATLTIASLMLFFVFFTIYL